MALNDTALNVMAEALAGVVTHLALHNGPLSTDEISTARQAADWSAAAGGDLSLSVGDSFTGPANAAITEVGLWGGLAGGTFYGTLDLTTGDLAFNAAGQYVLDDLTLSGSAS